MFWLTKNRIMSLWLIFNLSGWIISVCPPILTICPSCKSKEDTSHSGKLLFAINILAQKVAPILCNYISLPLCTDIINIFPTALDTANKPDILPNYNRIKPKGKDTFRKSKKRINFFFNNFSFNKSASYVLKLPKKTGENFFDLLFLSTASCEQLIFSPENHGFSPSIIPLKSKTIGCRIPTLSTR